MCYDLHISPEIYCCSFAIITSRLHLLEVHRSEIGSQCCNFQSDIVPQHRIDIDLTLINYVISYKNKHNSDIEIILIKHK